MKSLLLYFSGRHTLPLNVVPLRNGAIFVAATLMVVSLFYIGTNMNARQPIQGSGENERNFMLIPFDVLDAIQICRDKSVRQHGELLALLYVDYHSTRFDERDGMFKVFLKAHLGTHNDFDEAFIHCFVNPEQNIPEHYRTVIETRRSILKKAMDFFRRLK